MIQKNIAILNDLVNFESKEPFYDTNVIYEQCCNICCCINELVSVNQIEVIDKIFEINNPISLYQDIVLSLLLDTNELKHLLPNRENFYNNFYSKVKSNLLVDDLNWLNNLK